MADITAIIMTKNEEKNIIGCLDSIKNLCSRVVVIDCGSADKTVELAKGLGADVYFHEFEYYAKQFNWGLDNCDITTKWVIRLDADEQFPENLCNEIEKNIQLHDNNSVNGFVLGSVYFFMGKPLKRIIGKRKLMVFKYGKARIEDRRRDAHTILSDGEAIILNEKFLHYDFKDLNNFIARYNWYATREAQDYIDYKNGKMENEISDKSIQKRRDKKFGIYYRMPMFLRCFMLFVVNYIFKGNIFDGIPAFIYHVLSSFWYRFVVDAKIYEYEKLGKEFEKLKAFGE